MLGGYERGMAELAGYRDSERIESAARERVRGKSAGQLLEAAQRTMELIAIDLKIMGGTESLVDMVAANPRLRTYNEKFVTQAADVVVAREVVRVLGGK